MSFVGRRAELATLETGLAEARAGHGSTLFVTADAGGGKTTLVEHFLEEVRREAPEVRVAAGTCSEQFGSGEPYQPFLEAFHGLVIDEGEDGEEDSGLLEMAGELAPYWISAIPVAGAVMAATLRTAQEVRRARGAVEEGPGETGAGGRRAPPNEEALFYQYTELLFAAAERDPVVLFLDDLHWADQATCSLLGHVGRRIEDRPVLLLGTFRPADVEVAGHPIKATKQELERYGAAREIALEAMDEATLVELVRGELGRPPSERLLGFLVRRAGANPLFFGELLRWLVDEGYVREVRDELELVDAPADIVVPRSAESTIEKRLDGLDEETRRILEYAAVQGDEFDSTVLARLLDMDELELEEDLQRVVRVHQLVRPIGEREFPSGDFATLYLFRHSLIQDVLHSGLVGKRRILLHRKVAVILEELHEGDTTGVDWALAVHYEEGRQPERAFGAAVRAAERAASLYAHLDAIELFERALRVAPSDADRLDVLARMAEQHRVLGRFPEALDCLAEAEGVAESSGDEARLLEVRRQEVVVGLAFGHRTVRELAGELSELAARARAGGHREELCRILWCFRTLPRVDDGTVVHRIEALEEALAIAESLSRSELVARAHYNLGAALSLESDPAEAERHLDHALELYRALGDRAYIGFCQNSRAVARLLQGDYEGAREAFASAAEAFDEVGDPVESASVLNNLGVVQMRTGDWEAAEASFTRSLELAERLDATPRQLSPCENLGRLHLRRGDRARALESWERLLELARETGYWTQEVIAHCGIGLVHAEAGELTAARERLERARELAGGEGSWEVAEGLARLEARLARAEEDWERVAEVAARTAGEVRGIDLYSWANFRLLQGEALLRRGMEEGHAVVAEAFEAFGSLGVEPRERETASFLEARGREGRGGEPPEARPASGDPDTLRNGRLT